MGKGINYGDRIEFTGSVDARLDEVFAKAEKWLQDYFDEEGTLVGFRLFVRHPMYPKCTGYIEWAPAVLGFRPPDWEGRHFPKREISDDGLTPAKRIAELARYLVLGRETLERRRGGPEPVPDEERLRIIQGWYASKGHLLQEDYAPSQWIDASTLRRWIRELRAEGKLD